MRNLNEDQEYVTLKSEMKAKEWKIMGWSLVTGLAVAGIMVLTAGGAGLAAMSTAAIAGAATLAATGLVSVLNTVRLSMDLRYDRSELESRRQAVNFARVMSPQQIPQAAAYEAMSRKDGKTWAENLSERAEQTGPER